MVLVLLLLAVVGLLIWALVTGNEDTAGAAAIVAGIPAPKTP